MSLMEEVVAIGWALKSQVYAHIWQESVSPGCSWNNRKNSQILLQHSICLDAAMLSAMMLVN